jgi:DNA-binding IclR family transcriptional regulator
MGALELNETGSNASPRNYLLSSLQHAMDLLHCFTTDRAEWGVSELADGLGMRKSAVHRTLMTLMEHGYIKQNQNLKYALGSRLVYLSNLYRDRMVLLNCARPVLHSLAESTKKTCHIAKLQDKEVVYLLTVRPKGALVFMRVPAFRAPTYCTALGKVLLAHQPDEEQERIIRGIQFQPRTPNTITEVGRLHGELKQIRECGYAVDDEESVPKMRCIAAPIWNSSGRAEAAVSLSGHVNHISRKHLENYVGPICQTSAAVSASLG